MKLFTAVPIGKIAKPVKRPGVEIFRIPDPLGDTSTYFAESVKTSLGERGTMRTLQARALYVTIRNNVIEPLLKEIGTKKELKIWSACCGTGLETNSLKEIAKQVIEYEKIKIKGLQIIGADIDPECIQIAKDRFEKNEDENGISVNFEVNDLFGEKLPGCFGQASIDLAFLLGFGSESIIDKLANKKADYPIKHFYQALIPGTPLLTDSYWTNYFKHFPELFVPVVKMKGYSVDSLWRLAVLDISEENVPAVEYQFFRKQI